MVELFLSNAVIKRQHAGEFDEVLIRVTGSASDTLNISDIVPGGCVATHLSGWNITSSTNVAITNNDSNVITIGSGPSDDVLSIRVILASNRGVVIDDGSGLPPLDEEGNFWQTAGDGAFEDIPNAGTLEFLTWKDQIIDYRVAECPLERSTKIYVEVDVTLGNAIGGGGAGTQSDPFLIADANDFVTLFESQLDDDQEWICSGNADGQTSRATISDVKNVTIRSWEGKPKFRLTGFSTPLLGWTPHGSGNNVFVRTVTECFWVIDEEDDPTGDFTGHIATGGYPRYDSLEDLEALGSSDKGWFYDAGESELYVSVSSEEEPTGIRVCVNNEDGFLVSGSYNSSTGVMDTDNIRFHNIEVHGSGMNRTTSATQNYPIRASAAGPCRVVISNSKGYFTHHHGFSNLISGSVGNANAVGGIFTCVDSETGGCLQDSITVFTCFNNYAVNGLNEGYHRRLTTKLGRLSTPNARNASTMTGTMIFGHTDGSSSNPVGLVVSDDCWLLEEECTFPPSRLIGYNNTAVPDDGEEFDLAKYRNYIVGCRHYDDVIAHSPTLNPTDAVHICCDYRLYNDGEFGAFAFVPSGTSRRVGYFINTKFIWRNRSFAGWWRWNGDLSEVGNDQARFKFVHCYMKTLSAANNAVSIENWGDENIRWASSRAEFVNTIITHETLGSSGSLTLNLPNEGIGTGTHAGGLNHCAFWDVTSGQYDSTLNPVTLSAEPDIDVTPTSGELFEAGQSLSGDDTVQYDFQFRTRNTTSPNIGPLE